MYVQLEVNRLLMRGDVPKILLEGLILFITGIIIEVGKIKINTVCITITCFGNFLLQTVTNTRVIWKVRSLAFFSQSTINKPINVWYHFKQLHVSVLYVRA